MYRLIAASLLALVPLASVQVAAFAQGVPNAPGSQGITRDQFVQRAAEMAGRRFDEIDTAHAGVVTREQVRAFRQAHGQNQ